MTGDSGDLREGEFQQNLLLVIDNIDPGPVDSDDDVVLGQIWTWDSFYMFTTYSWEEECCK